MKLKLYVMILHTLCNDDVMMIVQARFPCAGQHMWGLLTQRATSPENAYTQHITG